MLAEARRVIVLAILLLALVPALPSFAEPVACDEYDEYGICIVRSGGAPLPGPPTPPGGGGPGGGSGGGGSSVFTGCVGEAMDPQPPPPEPGSGLGDPANGDIWVERVCYENGVEITRGGAFWGFAAVAVTVVDPAVLAAQAIASMTMLAPPIGMMPPRGSEGAIVGVPVWMWVVPGPTTTGSTSASASAGGVTVTAVAHVTEVGWVMGDESSSVSCGIGTPYDPAYGGGASPDCGYVYEVKSTKEDPAGVYTVTATSTWTIIWSGGGESGTEVLQLSSSVPLRVTEINVLNVPGG